MLTLLAVAALAHIPEPADERLLADHVFPMPLAVSGPFLSTYFGVHQGVGLLKIPEFVVEGVPKPASLQLGGLVETLDFQVRMTKATAVYGRATGQVTTGLDPDTTFFIGARGGYDGRLGVLFDIRRDDDRRYALAGRVFVRGWRALRVMPVRLFDALEEDRAQTVSALLRGKWARHLLVSEGGIQVAAGLSSAWSLSQRTGLQASATFRLGALSRERLSGEDPVRGSGVNLTGGLAVDWRANPVPFGFQIEAQDRFEAQGALDEQLEEINTNRALIGVTALYTGRPDLQVGLSVSSLVPIGKKDEQIWTLEARLAYYF